MGAWIEIFIPSYISKVSGSLPLWERGLKLSSKSLHSAAPQSLPLWERGLKLKKLLGKDGCMEVAPLVGAWIEINLHTGQSDSH